MKIFPAIDIINKKAVRLTQGDYEKMTVFNDNPVEVAKKFEEKGAKYLHIVDLDGAKNGTLDNFNVVKEIVDETNLFVEIGGGIRDLDRIDKYIELGVDRVILGTAAVNDYEFLKTAVKEYGEKIALGIDAKDGFVAVEGWKKKTDIDSFDFCIKARDIGVKNIIYTDIAKDGAMQGTNIDAFKRLMKIEGLNIIASGGVSSYEDIKKLRELKLDGAIIGKAIYLGAIELKEVVNDN
ncbi:MAG TPA: 1-(5-phosphoribosyl)-5-[(5-phosphoribosylamino)methylideneamino]imidazole-4-carboxamide isomerase [Anaerovoracaceae bacterium]|nr:1-(5-phosphoribosyl)-5-[(5-phosphoribosylamino)methylideneamino]imidazole-4-carboxamide isomerase [Anaerovoracaceae bacterium]